MLVWSAQVTRAQTFEKQLKASLTGQQELTSASAAVIQGKLKYPQCPLLRPLRPSVTLGPPLVRFWVYSPAQYLQLLC